MMTDDDYRNDLYLEDEHYRKLFGEFPALFKAFIATYCFHCEDIRVFSEFQSLPGFLYAGEPVGYLR